MEFWMSFAIGKLGCWVAGKRLDLESEELLEEIAMEAMKFKVQLLTMVSHDHSTTSQQGHTR